MRNWIFALLWTALANTAASAQLPTFADLAWGVSEADAIAHMEGIGFEFEEKDADGDLFFEGSLMGYETGAWVFLGGGEVVRVRVILITPDEDARPTYAVLRQSMIEKYGPPTGSVEEYDAPYAAGDGNEEQAFLDGKARMATFWKGSQDDAAGLTDITISQQLTVYVSYDGPGWAQEQERRRMAGASFFEE